MQNIRSILEIFTKILPPPGNAKHSVTLPDIDYPKSGELQINLMTEKDVYPFILEKEDLLLTSEELVREIKRAAEEGACDLSFKE